MSNTQSPLLSELARVADLLSNKIIEAVRMRDEYMKELQTISRSDAVGESVEIMRRMQVDDMEAASHLMLMATEMQMK
ncbi:hypothetical protein Tco_1315063, partial [Tanacetum coccineum]